MTIVSLSTITVQTMSSRAIADVVNKRHDNVKRTIETLSEKGVIQPPQIEEVKNHLGQTVQEYVINERDSYVVVAQLCPEFTAKLVDWWQETKGMKPQAVASAKPTALHSAFRSCIGIAKLAGLNGNQAILSADRATRKLLGQSPLELLEITHLHAPVQEVSLTPTQIGELLVPTISAIKVNQKLAEIGLQEKVAGIWVATEKGSTHCEVLDTGKKHGDGTPIKQLKWYQSVVEIIGMERAA